MDSSQLLNEVNKYIKKIIDIIPFDFLKIRRIEELTIRGSQAEMNYTAQIFGIYNSNPVYIKIKASEIGIIIKGEFYKGLERKIMEILNITPVCDEDKCYIHSYKKL